LSEGGLALPSPFTTLNIFPGREISMKKFLLALTLLFTANSFALISTASKYKLNNWMGGVAFDVGLGTLLQNAEGLEGPALANGKILVGNGSGVSVAVTPSGDVTVSNAGVTAIGAGKVLNAMLDSNIVRYADVSISSAEMLALNTTPKTLVASPGAGFALIPTELYSTITYASATYVCNAAGLVLKYTDGSGTAPGAVLTQGFCQSASSALQNVKVAATAYAPTTAAALVLHAGSANPTTGDSPVKVRIYYRVVPNPIP
jgi:hypothetical protein